MSGARCTFAVCEGHGEASRAGSISAWGSFAAMTPTGNLVAVLTPLQPRCRRAAVGRWITSEAPAARYPPRDGTGRSGARWPPTSSRPRPHGDPQRRPRQSKAQSLLHRLFGCMRSAGQVGPGRRERPHLGDGGDLRREAATASGARFVAGLPPGETECGAPGKTRAFRVKSGPDDDLSSGAATQRPGCENSLDP